MHIMEDYLVGKAPDARMLMEARDVLTERMFEITGRRASAVYKEPAVRGLLLRMLYPLL